jgi:hypothetical protein
VKRESIQIYYRGTYQTKAFCPKAEIDKHVAGPTIGTEVSTIVLTIVIRRFNTDRSKTN